MQTVSAQDKTLLTLASFVIAQKHVALSEAEFFDGRRRLLDTLGCGLAAFHQAPCVKARHLALQEGTGGVASLWGTQQRTSAALAAFSNGWMARYLDGADTYPGGGGHPSDCWAGLLAVAEARALDVSKLLIAARVAYSVFHNLFESAQLRDKGVDNSFYVTLGTAAGCAFLMELDQVQTAHALALAVVPNVSLAVARTGALSMWKAGASANASRNGVFAAQLAEAGLQGPAMPFEGIRGLWDLTGPFALEPFDQDHSIPRMQLAHMKQFLCDYHSQTPILAAMQLHQELQGEPIESVVVHTYEFAYSEVASDPEKWTPLNRETADHSMPWIVAGILIHGNFGEHLFSPEQLQNPQHLALTQKIRVLEDPELSLRFPNEIPCRISVETTSGRRLQVQVDLPMGHPRHPMTDESLKNKFLTLTTPILAEHAQSAFEAIWQIRPNQSVRSVLQSLAFPLSSTMTRSA
jgi:2-methylcitrate dehydratase